MKDNNHSRKIWDAFTHTIAAFCYILITAVLTYLFISIVITFKYGNTLYCSECEQGYVFSPGQDYCTTCGVKHSDDDMVDIKPHCLNCGWLGGIDYNKYCAKCGGIISCDGRIKLSEIENPVIRFCINGF